MIHTDIKTQIFYRGELKSCNYSCSYCPFSKRILKKDLEQDKKSLERFICKLEKQELKTKAIQFVPYGEALIHSYYWRAIGRLSKLDTIEAVGCQTNLSFLVEKMLEVFLEEFGEKEKLRLWCTFHPSMVSVEKFVEQCKKLENNLVAFCVGVVGVPEQIGVIKELRKSLPQSVYIWVNPMDGLKRSYTKEEIESFTKIDPFFPYQLKHKKANSSQCKGCKGESLFIHANGDITACNISRQKIGNLYEELCEKISSEQILVEQTSSIDSVADVLEIASGSAEKFIKDSVEIFDGNSVQKYSCKQKECSCFLAYCNREDYKELMFFGDYPAFRIANIPKAMFFDVDGTLVKKGSDTIEQEVVEQIKHWSYHTKIYLATSLPFPHAMKKCRQIKQYLSGGVFANGGMIYLSEEKKTEVIPIEVDLNDFFETVKSNHSIKVCEYKKDDIIYKITCTGRRLEQIKEMLEQTYGDKLTIIIEENHLELTGKTANKLNGVLTVCNYYNYKQEEVFVVGDSENDKEMIEYFPMSFKVEG